MGRTKGSKNKPKSNQPKSETPDVTQEPKSKKEEAAATAVEEKKSTGETTPAGDPGEPIGATGETPAESASGQSSPADVGASGAAGEVGGEQKNAKKSEAGGLDEHRAATPKVKDEQHTVERMNARIRSLWRDRAMEKQQASEDAKEHSDEIKRIEGEIDKLVQKLEELDIEEIPNHERGLVEYRSKSTGKLIRTRPMVAADRQGKLPFDKSKQAPPEEPAPAKKETFSDLRDGKIWEHDQYGCVRILAVLDESVRVQTEDLHEPAEGIEIGKADWNANAAYPREVPELAVGQRWQMGGDTIATITALDDFAACYDAQVGSGDPTSCRVSRLWFCAADVRQVTDSVIVPGTIEVGKHYRLMDEGIADGNRLVTVTAVGDGMIDVRWAHSGLGGSVPRAEFAFAEAATQEEIEATLVAPAKKSRRGKKAEPEAADVRAAVGAEVESKEK